MGSKGLEIVKIHPNILSEEILNEIALKSMPMGAKEYDFITVTLADMKVFSALIFTVPLQLGRDNIVSLIAVFKSINYNAEIIQKNFVKIITGIKENLDISIEVVSKLLYDIFEGIKREKFKLNLPSNITIDLDFSGLSLKSKKDKVKNLTSDVWG